MKKLVTILLLALPLLLMAQYTLDELVETGLQKATPMQTSMLELENSQSSLRSSWWDMAPSAGLSAGHSVSDDGNSTSFSATVSKSISLDEPTYFNLKRNRLALQNAKLSLTQQKRQTAYQIFSLYIDVIQAQRELNIQKSNLELQDKLTRQTQVLFDVKKATTLDVQQSQVNLLDARISVENAQNALIDAREALFDYLDMADTGDTLVAPAVDIGMPDTSWVEPLNVTMQRNQIKSSQFTLQQERLGFLPDFSLSFNWNHSDSSPEFDLAFDNKDTRESTTLMFSASYDLLNWFEQGESYSRSERSLNITQLQLDDDIRTQKTDLTRLARQWDLASRSWDLYKQKLDLARQNLRLSEESYSLGRIDLTERDQAQLNLLTASLQELQQYYNLLKLQEQINLARSQAILGRW